MREPAATIIARIEASWADWLDTIADLAPEDLAVPDSAGGWSVTAAMAHVALWDRLAAENAERRARGGGPRRLDFDALNALHAAHRRGQPARAARIEMLTTHAEMLVRLARLPTIDPVWIAVDTWDHYPEHTAAVLAWRRNRGG